jgi:hypothetical protein
MTLKTELIFVPIKNLSVMWVQAQRPLNDKWAQKIATDFDPDKFDPPVITKPNGVGQYHIVDGQHRVAAAKMAFGENEQLQCRMVDCEDCARAAEIFYDINSSRKPMQPVIRFLVAVEAKREPQTSINALVKKLGCHIGPAKTDNTIGAVAALMEVHRKYEMAVLEAALVMLIQTWKGDPSAFNGELIRGYGSFINEFHHHMDPKRLVETILKTFTPHQLKVAGRQHAGVHRVTIAEGVAETLRAKYNYNAREAQKLKRK